MKTAYLIIALLSLTGCRLFPDPKLSGGSAEERAMAHGAFNRQIPILRQKGYVFRDKRENVTLIPVPAVRVNRLRSGRMQGVMANGAYASANGRTIRYARPATPEMFDHEVKHSILSWGGYDEESRTHARKPFPEGGVIR